MNDGDPGSGRGRGSALGDVSLAAGLTLGVIALIMIGLVYAATSSGP